MPLSSRSSAPPRGKGRSSGALHGLKPIDLVVGLIDELRIRFPDLDENRISDVILGCVESMSRVTIPITDLAQRVRHAENFIGTHFFSPVDKMDPVEIIRDAKTSDETLAKAIDLVLAIGKYPIVVNDGRGFFTTRVFATFLAEASRCSTKASTQP